MILEYETCTSCLGGALDIDAVQCGVAEPRTGQLAPVDSTILLVLATYGMAKSGRM